MDTTNLPDPVDVYAGARVRDRRHELKLSQQALGDAIGVSFQQIQKYERGTNRISLSMLHRIATVLKTPDLAFFLPPVGAEIVKADPVAARAKAIYERDRIGTDRPPWDALRPTDFYDQAMRQVALTAAEAEITTLINAA